MNDKERVHAEREARETRERKVHREAVILGVFRRIDGELFPGPEEYEETLEADRTTNERRVFWEPDNEAFEETGMWTSRAIIDGEPSLIVITMGPNQDFDLGAEVTLETGGLVSRTESIEKALERIDRLYPESTE